MSIEVLQPLDALPNSKMARGAPALVETDQEPLGLAPVVGAGIGAGEVVELDPKLEPFPDDQALVSSAGDMSPGTWPSEGIDGVPQVTVPV